MGKIVSRIKESPGTSFLIALLLVLVTVLYVRPFVIEENGPTTPTDIVIDYANFTDVTGFGLVRAGDATDIQAQIDVCPRSGCTILVPPGIYVIEDTIVINNSHSNIRLVGSGAGHFHTGGATSFLHGTSGKNIINITGSGIASQMVSNIVIENIYFSSDYTKRGYAIYAQYTSIYGVKLLDNVFYKFYDPAVAMKVTWGFLADHNTFHGCGNTVEDSSAIQYLEASPHHNTFVQIVNNLFEVDGYGAIDTTHSTSSYIDGNWIEGGEGGIKVGSGARVTGNYLHGIGDIGIYSGHAGTIIENNQITMDPASKTSKGIKVWNGALIAGNVVLNAGYGGIWAYGDQNTISGNRITSSGADNTITGGIVIKGIGNVVANNVIKDRGEIHSSGIVIRDQSSYNIVIGNTIDGVYNGINEKVTAGHGYNAIVGNVITQWANVAIYSDGVDTELSHNIIDGE